MDSRKLALLCREFADNKKAENIVVLDVRKISSITDYFVLASGSTEPHLRAIASEIKDRLRAEHSVRPRAVEGDAQTPWQVVDYFDVIVHVMRNDVRSKYDLESLWGDAPRVRVEAEAPAPEVAPETAAPEPARKPRASKAPKEPKAPKAVKAPRAAKAEKPAKAPKKAPVKRVRAKKSADNA